MTASAKVVRRLLGGDIPQHAVEGLPETVEELQASIAVASTDGLRPTNAQAADYTLVLGDLGKAVQVDSATAKAVTVPPNASVAFPIGAVIEVVQAGAGAVTLVAGVGVTITGDTAVPAQGASLLLRKTGTNAWWSSIVGVRSGTYPENPTPGTPRTAVVTATDQTVDGIKTFSALVKAPSGFLVEHTVPENVTFPVDVKVSGPNGLRSRFRIEHNLETDVTCDVNIRDADINIGDPDSSASESALMKFYSPAGTSYEPIRVYQPGSNSALSFALWHSGLIVSYATGQASTAFQVAAWGADNAVFSIGGTAGLLSWGPGGGSPLDATLARSAAGTLKMAGAGGLQVAKIDAADIATTLIFQAIGGALIVASDTQVGVATITAQGVFGKLGPYLRCQNSSDVSLFEVTKDGVPKWALAANQTTTPPAGASKYFAFQDSAGTTYYLEGKLA